MSEKLYDIKDLKLTNRMTIDIEDPQQLRDLACRFEAASKERSLPGEVSIEITPSIQMRYDPSKNKSSIPFRGNHNNREILTSEL